MPLDELLVICAELKEGVSTKFDEFYEKYPEEIEGVYFTGPQDKLEWLREDMKESVYDKIEDFLFDPNTKLSHIINTNMN